MAWSEQQWINACLHILSCPIDYCTTCTEIKKHAEEESHLHHSHQTMESEGGIPQ